MITDAKIEDWSAEEYFASDAISRSDLCDVLDSPALFHGMRSGEIPRPEPTPAMRFGTAVHLSVLEPEEAERLIMTPRKFDCRRKGQKEAKAEYEASLPPGALYFSAEDTDRIKRCADAVRAHRRAMLLLEGRKEVSFSWTEDGLRCRSRLDSVLVAKRAAFITDLKTAEDPSPDGFAKSAIKHGYDLQTAWYPRAVPQALGVDRHRFAFVVVRNKYPFEVAIHHPDADFLRLGEARARRAMELIKRCTESEDWSAPWQQQVNTLSAPRWALKAEGL